MANRYDNFASGDLDTPDDGGAAWERPVTFSFSASGNQLANIDAGNGRFCILNCDADGTFDIKVKTRGPDYAGVIVRYADANNWFLVRWFGTSIGVYTVVAGTGTDQGSVTSNVSSGDIISVVMSGNSYTIKRNGTTVQGPLTISGLSSNTKHGVRTDSDTTTIYDDVVWTMASAGGTVTADQGSFSFTGQTAGLLFNRTLTADYGAYALTGQTVTLQKDTPGAFTMPADAGSYSWNGSDALGAYAMNANSGSYALTGQEVTFSIGVPTAYSMPANAGSYTFNGQNARLDWSGAPIVPNRQAGIYMGMRTGL